MSRTLFRYLVFEVLGPFVIGLVILSFVLLMFQLLKLTELIVSYGVALADIGLLLAYIFPPFFTFTIPMSFLLAVLLAVSRLSSESEITAMKAGGIGLVQLYPPILFLSIVMAVATAFLALYADPWGKAGFKNMLIELGRQKATVAIVEHVFNDSLEDMTLYVHHLVPEEDKMEGIFLADQRQQDAPIIVTAALGRLLDSGREDTLLLELEDGVVHRTDPGEPGVYETVQFRTYRIQVDLGEVMGGGDKLRHTYLEMDMGELAAYVASLEGTDKDYERRRAWTEYHRRIAMPFVCLAFGLIALPLGISPPRSGRSRGFSTSIVVLCVYYLLFRAGENMGWKGLVHPAVAMWVPNVLMVAFGAYLLQRKANERPIWLLEKASKWSAATGAWFRAKFGVRRDGESDS
ncbi:MAG: LPS export ABC transporter permease LptF [Candidatus Lernaella stagnicola]|nr:LPS export ABC transporter permease LptF [Candidatus Lernaella stagnicola]